MAGKVFTNVEGSFSIHGCFAGQEGILSLIRQTLTAGRSISDDETIYLQRAAAPSIPVSITVSPLFGTGSDQEGTVLIIRDLSRVRELEEALRHADRLSMLGTLAAGLAHEVKNPLGGIRGAAQLLEMELGENSPLCEYTSVMIKEVERVNNIIEAIWGFFSIYVIIFLFFHVLYQLSRLFFFLLPSLLLSSLSHILFN